MKTDLVCSLSHYLKIKGYFPSPLVFERWLFCCVILHVRPVLLELWRCGVKQQMLWPSDIRYRNAIRQERHECLLTEQRCHENSRKGEKAVPGRRLRARTHPWLRAVIFSARHAHAASSLTGKTSGGCDWFGVESPSLSKPLLLRGSERVSEDDKVHCDSASIGLCFGGVWGCGVKRCAA